MKPTTGSPWFRTINVLVFLACLVGLPHTALVEAKYQVPGGAGEPPTLQQVLGRAGEYVLDYGARMAVIVGKEQYWQRLFSASGARTLESEIAFVKVGDDWLGFRDVHKVDGVPVGDREDRLARLFHGGAGGTLTDARRFSDESARYNVGAIVRNFNMPTTALLILQPNNQGRFRFKRSGQQAVAGREVWRLRFEEVQKPTLIRTSANMNLPVSGEFWIRVEDGAVLRSRIELSAETRITGQSVDLTGLRVRSTASVEVTYQRDDRLELLVPSEMVEAYEGPWAASGGEQSLTRINCRATYSQFRRFETNGRMIAPR